MERKHGPRARDTDRNEVIETVQNAYVEDQLDSGPAHDAAVEPLHGARSHPARARDLGSSE